MIDFHDGHTVKLHTDEGGSVEVGINTYRQIVLTLVDRNGGRRNTMLTPEDALQVALALQRERSLLVTGSG